MCKQQDLDYSGYSVNIILADKLTKNYCKLKEPNIPEDTQTYPEEHKLLAN